MTAKEYLEQIYVLDDKINSDLRELKRMHDSIPLAREGRMTLVDEVHHIIPLSRGGDHTSDNLMSLCRSCHNKIHKELGDR